MAKSTKQIQEEITSKIVESLKAGTIPWRKPWSTSPNCGAPANIVSGKAYRGINPLLLELHRQEHDFSCKHYATWNQWRDLGATVMRRPAHVKPGEWGSFTTPRSRRPKKTRQLAKRLKSSSPC